MNGVPQGHLRLQLSRHLTVQVAMLFQAKALADSKNDRARRPRETAPEFLTGQLIRHFGLRSIALRNLRNLAGAGDDLHDQ